LEQRHDSTQEARPISNVFQNLSAEDYVIGSARLRGQVHHVGNQVNAGTGDDVDAQIACAAFGRDYVAW
jgi:hypothetical protein